MSHTCSIVIRAFNEEKHIARLLQGIKMQTVQDVEVILVDSGSTDATVAIAAGHGAAVIHIPPEEFTFGRSLNLGVESASREFVVIASAHVYPVFADWLERLLEPFQETKVALAYGKQRGDTTTQFSEQQIFAQWFPEHSDPRQAHPFCNNANAAIRRSLWEGHPYDETLTGLEDLAWATWAMHEGHALAYVAEAEVIHVHEESPQSVFNRYRREAIAFKRIFPSEHFGLGNFLRLLTGNITNDLWHAAQKGLLTRSLRGIFWFRWMQFWGTYQGYRQSGPLTWQLRQTFYYPRGMGVATERRERDVQPIRYNGKP
jgi:glycosyltransferase involved in cell wall biosynthesis